MQPLSVSSIDGTACGLRLDTVILGASAPVTLGGLLAECKPLSLLVRCRGFFDIQF